MLPLIWIYVRIRTSPDGSRRHRQNLFDRPPLFFFSSLISFAENSANSLYEQSGGRLEFFFRRRRNIFLIKLSRVINFKKFTFTWISVYFFFSNLNKIVEKTFFPQIWDISQHFSTLNSQFFSKGRTQRSIKKNMYLSHASLSKKKRNDEAM